MCSDVNFTVFIDDIKEQSSLLVSADCSMHSDEHVIKHAAVADLKYDIAKDLCLCILVA